MKAATMKVKLANIEEKLTELRADRNVKLVKEYIGSLEDAEGRFNPTGMWRLKNKLLPREYDPPMAKKDNFGNLITAPEPLKQLYLETYKERLKHRKINDEFIENYEKKVMLWDLRFKMLKSSKSENWTLKQLDKALLSLKKNKTRDPGGLINELFKPPVMGDDLKCTVLSLINGMKANYYIPPEVEMANITTIYKKKGSRYDLEKEIKEHQPEKTHEIIHRKMKYNVMNAISKQTVLTV